MIQSQSSPCLIYGERSGTGKSFSLGFPASSYNYILICYQDLVQYAHLRFAAPKDSLHNREIPRYMLKMLYIRFEIFFCVASADVGPFKELRFVLIAIGTTDVLFGLRIVVGNSVLVHSFHV
jgi:hypothetical protein